MFVERNVLTAIYKKGFGGNLRQADLCCMEHLLNNPVYHALMTGDAHLAMGTGIVRYFDAEVSPFAGFPHSYTRGFDDLYEQLPDDRSILYANPEKIETPINWRIAAAVEGLQFIYQGTTPAQGSTHNIVPLDHHHAEEMVALAALTKPGPFGMRTIDFGHYHGIFVEGKLVAMTGQRMHVYHFTELSAVCTHPNHLGKGYAGALMQHQLEIILSQGQQPFLHVRADNDRAIALYKRLGFVISRPMQFYFMRKKRR